jgi:hypothetical protein
MESNSEKPEEIKKYTPESYVAEAVQLYTHSVVELLKSQGVCLKSETCNQICQLMDDISWDCVNYMRGEMRNRLENIVP